VIYFYGGPEYASCGCNAAGTTTLPYYFIGWGVLALYLPMYWYRKRYEDKREVAAVEPVPSVAPIAREGVAE
jgi:hypothetical protein